MCLLTPYQIDYSTLLVQFTSVFLFVFAANFSLEAAITESSN